MDVSMTKVISRDVIDSDYSEQIVLLIHSFTTNKPDWLSSQNWKNSVNIPTRIRDIFKMKCKGLKQDGQFILERLTINCVALWIEQDISKYCIHTDLLSQAEHSGMLLPVVV